MLGTDHFRTPEDPAIVAMIVRCVWPSWLVPVGGSRRGYARVGALAAGSPDGIAILWSWVG